MLTDLNSRQQRICQLLDESKELKVAQLAEYFTTSEVTIRKDLKLLEENNLLIRKFGGAKALTAQGQQIMPTNNIVDSPQKLAIARLAATMIQDNFRILIDSGTTTNSIIPLLNQFSNLVVMTNSLLVASKLLSLPSHPTLLMTGGTWDARSNSFQGKVAEQTLSAYNFDLLLIGADGLDVKHGSTTYNEITSLSNKMADVANKVVLMIESNKINRKIPNIELTWDKIDVLVTDQGIDPSIKAQIEVKQVMVLTAAS